MHRHYDADNNLTGYTVVEREPEWDDDTFSDAAAYLAYGDMACNGCGKDLTLTTRADVNWNIEMRTVCRSCASIAVAERMEEDKHKDEKPIPGKAMWNEGRLVTAQPVYPKPRKGGDT